MATATEQQSVPATPPANEPPADFDVAGLFHDAAQKVGAGATAESQTPAAPSGPAATTQQPSGAAPAAQPLTPPVGPPQPQLGITSTPAAAPPAVAAVTSDPILEHAQKALGLDTSSFKSGTELTERMWQLIENQRQEMDALRRQYATPTQPAVPVTGQPQAQEPAGFDPEKYFAEAWPVQWKPEYDAALQSKWVVQNEQGAFVPAQGFEAFSQLAVQMNQAAVGRQQVTNQFGQNPVRFMYDKLQQPFMQAVEARVSEILE
jgi:hypothetical protein